MPRDATLNAMIYFEAVARNGRVARAAEELLVSPSAVSQQIRVLEELLGVSLFRRDKRQLSLTLEGEELYRASSSAFGILSNAKRTIARHRETNQLILKVSPSFGVRWLGPRLSAFIAQQPTWDFRIDASADPSNFEREVVDFDIRYGRGQWPGLHCETILHDYILPMCSPTYLEQLGNDSKSLASIVKRARLIDSTKTVWQWDDWLARQGTNRASALGALRFERSSMAIQLAVDGVGVILDSTTLACDELLSGALVPLAPGLGAIRFPAYWIVCPARHQSRRLVQEFSQWLLSTSKSHDEQIRNYLEQKGINIIDDPSMNI